VARTRFLFATDLHGSEEVWRKFLNSSKHFDLNALVLSGDMTGKLIVPIVKTPEGTYRGSLHGKDYVMEEKDLPPFEEQVRRASYIPYRTTPEEAEEIAAKEDVREKLFERLQMEIVGHWLTLIPPRVPDKCRVVLSPGNDDKFGIDDVIKSYPRVIYGEENVVHLDDEHEVACFGWTNPTPWNSPRECSEEELWEKLEKVIAQVHNLRSAVFCLHCPPYDSQIDLAPKLNPDLTPVYAHGRPVMIPAGSKSIRRAIEKYQPLIGLHGHIHESAGFVRIGRTQCLNPGSEYGEGVLRAYLVELDREKIVRLQRVEA